LEEFGTPSIATEGIVAEGTEVAGIEVEGVGGEGIVGASGKESVTGGLHPDLIQS
jgi:hypothetical protein